MVELIPKPVEQAARWQTILFYFLAFLAAGLVAAYFLLNNLQNELMLDSAELDVKIAQGKTSERITMESETIEYKKKIERFYPFLKAHVLSLNFFDFLEQRTHPRIFFSKINLDAENAKATLTGQTDSFLSLDQQMSLLNEEPLIKSIALVSANLNKAGGVDFAFDMVLAPTVFKYEYPK